MPRSLSVKTGLLAFGVLLLVGLSIAHASSAEISRAVPGGITVYVVPTEALADIDGNGVVDHRDLMAIRRKLGLLSGPDAVEDINRDGTVDVLDLAIVARYFGLEVQQWRSG